MEIAKKALIDEGYELVEVDITAEDLSQGRNFLIGICANIYRDGIWKDMVETGEVMISTVVMYFTITALTGYLRSFFIFIAKYVLGMHRAVECISHMQKMEFYDFEQFTLQRFLFGH